MVAPTQNLIPLPELQFFNNAGAVLAGGSINTFDADGITPKLTYKDPFGNTANTNPLILDPSGRALIYGTGQYVFEVADSLGNVLYTEPTADPSAILGISSAMLPVVQAVSTAAALALLGGAAVGTSIPVGLGPLPWSAAAAPAYWRLCYGQELSRSTYSDLFAVIGTTFGAGNGSTTFNLPDCRGNVVACADAMGGTPANRLTSASLGTAAVLGLIGGNEDVQSHTHVATDSGHTHGITLPIGGHTSPGGSGTPGASGASFTTAAGFAAITNSNFGTGTSLNVQPIIVTNMIIFVGVP